MRYLIITDARIAGHCTTGTSNKVWTACLAVEANEQAETVQAVNLATLPSNSEVVFLCGHGPYGAALRLEEPKRMTRQAAQNLLRKKWQEKDMLLWRLNPLWLPLANRGDYPCSSLEHCFQRTMPQ